MKIERQRTLKDIHCDLCDLAIETGDPVFTRKGWEGLYCSSGCAVPCDADCRTDKSSCEPGDNGEGRCWQCNREWVA